MALNPRTNKLRWGMTPEMEATLRQMGVDPFMAPVQQDAGANQRSRQVLDPTFLEGAGDPESSLFGGRTFGKAVGLPEGPLSIGSFLGARLGAKMAAEKEAASQPGYATVPQEGPKEPGFLAWHFAPEYAAARSNQRAMQDPNSPTRRAFEADIAFKRSQTEGNEAAVAASKEEINRLRSYRASDAMALAGRGNAPYTPAMTEEMFNSPLALANLSYGSAKYAGNQVPAEYARSLADAAAARGDLQSASEFQSGYYDPTSYWAVEAGAPTVTQANAAATNAAANQMQAEKLPDKEERGIERQHERDVAKIHSAGSQSQRRAVEIELQNSAIESFGPENGRVYFDYVVKGITPPPEMMNTFREIIKLRGRMGSIDQKTKLVGQQIDKVLSEQADYASRYRQQTQLEPPPTDPRMMEFQKRLDPLWAQLDAHTREYDDSYTRLYGSEEGQDRVSLLELSGLDQQQGDYQEKWIQENMPYGPTVLNLMDAANYFAENIPAPESFGGRKLPPRGQRRLFLTREQRREQLLPAATKAGQAWRQREEARRAQQGQGPRIRHRGYWR